MKGLLKQDHEVLFQRIRTFRDKLTSGNHEGGFFNLLRVLKRFMLSLMDYRQDCKTVFHSLVHGRSLCQRSSSIAWRHKDLLCSRLDISSNSTESWSGTLNHYLNVKYLDSLIAPVRQKNCILVFSNLKRAILNIVLWRSPFKKKIWLENFRNSTCLGNGTFRLYRPDSSDRAFNYFSCKQDAKERYRGQQFVKWKGTFRSDRPKWADRSKKATFKGGLKYSVGPNQNGPFRLISNLISGILDWMESALL